MIDASLDPSSFSYGLLITRILEANNIYLDDTSPIFVKQCYNLRASVSVGYVHTDGSWEPKFDFCPVSDFTSLRSKEFLPFDPSTPSPSYDILVWLTNMDSKLDAL